MQDLNQPVIHHNLSCFLWKMNSRCPAVVSDYGCHGRACTLSYLLALEQVMKTPELMGAGFFHFIQSFGENKKSSSKQIKNKTSKSHMKDLLLFLPPSEKSKPFCFKCLFFASYKTTQKLQIAFWRGQSCSALQECFVLFFFLNEIVFS